MQLKFHSYNAPAGGWGSVRSLAKNFARNGNPVSAGLTLMNQNKPRGYACPSCAWAKPAAPHIFEFCENGAKATAWELTQHRATPTFFAQHTVCELESWSDNALESTGRLTQPMRYDAATDHYVPVSWESAFADIGERLRRYDANSAVFYASGRASLETAYMYQLLARLHGTNNLPDCSNMCHETTSLALPESIGVPVGTVILEDFQHADAIFFFGQNVGSNSPRMLHDLQEARRRGVPIVTFNPLRERGLEEFTNPQSPKEMLAGEHTRISTQFHQVKTGGDMAAIMGMCKALITWDDARHNDNMPVLDWDFIHQHGHGFEEFAAAARAADWAALERRSGLTRNAIEAAALVYARANAVIGIYGMGLTQHVRGVATVQMLANLLLLRGNIGKPGAGICPVRGHSNVQGQRTVGITEKPDLAPLDRLAQQYGFTPPRDLGMNTVEVCEAMQRNKVKAFIGLGGNFIRAVPDREPNEAAWRRIPLTVQISTKLNRSHVVHGEAAYILPCLGRTEVDEQASGPQAVSLEDSTGCFHGSQGRRALASEHLRSEPAIVAGIAKAALDANPLVPWDGWVANYARIREAIAATYPETFSDMSHRMWQPGGFHRKLAARHREWKTKTGKANFITPSTLATDIDMPAEQRDVVQLITLRSNDQFNTTVYGYDDRFRGVHGTRMVVLMHRNDMARFELDDRDIVSLTTAVDDGRLRTMSGFTVLPYDIPEGNIGGYYPECNALIPLWHHAEGSKTPAAKSIPVRVQKVAMENHSV
jgi:molybdopterin-dependent oxidoreductase alpha subunit